MGLDYSYLLYFKREHLWDALQGVELLERLPGICGIFNREDSGEVFWYKGHVLSDHIEDPYLLPDEIISLLNLQD